MNKVSSLHRSETAAIKTEVAEPTQNPIWNTTLELKNVRGEHLMEKTIEVTLWDYKPDKEQVFLGKYIYVYNTAFSSHWLVKNLMKIFSQGNAV